VGQKALDRGLRGDAADIAAADAICQHDGDAFEAQQRFVRDQNAVKILIGLLATFVRMLPDRYFQFTRHLSQQKWGVSIPWNFPWELRPRKADTVNPG